MLLFIRLLRKHRKSSVHELALFKVGEQSLAFNCLAVEAKNLLNSLAIC